MSGDECEDGRLQIKLTPLDIKYKLSQKKTIE